MDLDAIRKRRAAVEPGVCWDMRPAEADFQYHAKADIDALLACIDELEIEAISVTANAMWTSNIHADRINAWLRSRGFAYDWNTKTYSRLPKNSCVADSEGK